MTTTRDDGIRRLGTVLLLSSAFGLLTATTIQAQVPDRLDGRWLPWIGCWEPVDGASEVGMLCIRGSELGDGVELLTVVDGRVSQTERLVADGMARSANQQGCVGEESAEFSLSGDRVYLRSEHICGGNVGRSSEGMFSMTTPSEWVQIETVEVDGREASWVQRYQLAPPAQVEALGLGDFTSERMMAIESARIAASSPLTVEDIIEASNRLDEESLRVWIAERGEPLDLSADLLQQMADAGVPASVIDVVVGVSYPDQFAIDREFRQNRGYAGDPYYGPRYYDPFYRYGSGGAGFGYYGSRYGFGLYDSYRPTIVIVAPRDDSPAGRVIRGRGYSRGGSSSGGSSAGSSSAGRSSAGSSSGSTGRTAKPKPGGGGGGGAVASASPPTSTSSSSSASTGRTAKPRPGGGW